MFHKKQFYLTIRGLLVGYLHATLRTATSELKTREYVSMLNGCPPPSLTAWVCDKIWHHHHKRYYSHGCS